MKKWETFRTEPMGDFRVFSVRKQWNRSPESGKEGDFFVIDASDWINVMAITADNQVVLVEQYRHGSDRVSLELPGGCIDAGETPLAAARRELEEETGFTSEDWVELGWNDPNPALFSNRCFSFLARNAKLSRPQALDSMEEITVHTVPLADIPKLVAEQKITHSLILTTFYYYDLWKKGLRA